MDSGWLKVLDIGGPRAATLCAICGAVSVGYERKLFHLAQLPPTAVLGANVGFLIFGAATAAWLVGAAALRVRRWFGMGRYREAIADALGGLSGQEWDVLAGMMARGHHTALGGLFDPVMCSLVSKGLLERAHGTGDTTAWVHSMPKEVREALSRFGQSRLLLQRS
jgi:hypothetical protein